MWEWQVPLTKHCNLSGESLTAAFWRGRWV